MSSLASDIAIGFAEAIAFTLSIAAIISALFW